MTADSRGMAELAGRALGERTVSFDERDAILYAIAVGARAHELELVYERGLRVLPTLACALGLWAVEAAGTTGAYDRTSSLHVGQTLVMKGPFESGPVAMSASVTDVWDKGRASVLGVEVDSAPFTASYTIFLPGVGGWGGERGPPTAGSDPLEASWSTSIETSREAAVLYRLTGDLHPVHVDPDVSGPLGFERPILHGLATVGIAARAAAGAIGAHPADLRTLEARLVTPVLPGEVLDLAAAVGGSGQIAVEVTAPGGVALIGSFSYA